MSQTPEKLLPDKEMHGVYPDADLRSAARAVKIQTATAAQEPSDNLPACCMNSFAWATQTVFFCVAWCIYAQTGPNKNK